MENLAFIAAHNSRAILTLAPNYPQFHPVVNLLRDSQLFPAFTIHGDIYSDHLQAFWKSATLSVDGQELRGRIAEHDIVITEEVIRRSLNLNDAGAVFTYPAERVRQCMEAMGYNQVPIGG